MSAPFDRSNAIFRDLPIRYIHPDRACEWLPDVPPSTSKQLSENERLWVRLSQIIMHHYDLESCPRLSGDTDQTIAMLNQATLMRVVEIGGAIWHGRTLSKLIDKTALSAALSVIDEATHRMAVANADLAPLPAHNQDFEPEPPAPDAILLNGKLCFISWMNALPGFLSKRIALKFPTEFLSEMPTPDHEIYGPAIVRKSAEAFVHD
jgi:hypothetical protein